MEGVGFCSVPLPNYCLSCYQILHHHPESRSNEKTNFSQPTFVGGLPRPSLTAIRNEDDWGRLPFHRSHGVSEGGTGAEDRKPYKTRVLGMVLRVLPVTLQVGAVKTPISKHTWKQLIEQLARDLTQESGGSGI